MGVNDGAGVSVISCGRRLCRVGGVSSAKKRQLLRWVAAVASAIANATPDVDSALKDKRKK